MAAQALVASHKRWIPGFNSRPIHVEFVVDNVTLTVFFSGTLVFLESIIHQSSIFIHLYLSQTVQSQQLPAHLKKDPLPHICRFIDINISFDCTQTQTVKHPITRYVILHSTIQYGVHPSCFPAQASNSRGFAVRYGISADCT
jgi:hypothetical protein